MGLTRTLQPLTPGVLVPDALTGRTVATVRGSTWWDAGSGGAAYVETATVAGDGAVTAADAATWIEAGTVAGAGSVAATDIYTPGGAVYVETGTVAGAGAVVAADAVAWGETGTVAGAGAVVITDAVALVELGIVAGEGAVVAVDVSSVTPVVDPVLVLAMPGFQRRAGPAGRGSRRWMG